jgi:hypothetical protein
LQITNARQALAVLRQILENWNGDGFETVSWLIIVPPGDGNFKHALKHAPAAALRYALALCSSSGHKTRISAITRRLQELDVKPA